MFRKFGVGFAIAALAVAGAASSYRVSVFEKASAGGAQLPAGDYRVVIKDNKAIFSQGKHSMEAPVKVETTEQKFASTSVKYVNGAITEIRLGGTNTKLVFNEQQGTN